MIESCDTWRPLHTKLIRLCSTKSIWNICLNSIILIIPHQNDTTSYCELTYLCKQEKKKPCSLEAGSHFKNL